MHFPLNVVAEVGALDDDVHLIDGKDRIPDFAWLTWDITVTGHGHEFRRLVEARSKPVLLFVRLGWLVSPFRPPKAVLDIKPKSFERPLQHATNNVIGFIDPEFLVEIDDFAPFEQKRDEVRRKPQIPFGLRVV